MKHSNTVNTTTFIHHDTTLTAEITCEGNLHISGTINGNVEAKSLVVIDQGGSITGNLQASETKISGKVVGDLRIQGTLTLLPSAIITGNIFARNLVTETGARIDGSLMVGKNVDIASASVFEENLPLQKKAG